MPPSIKPIYLISGDVPFLRQEARDSIRQAAQQAGYQEHQKLTVETSFDWSDLTQAAANYSLFSDRTCIELYNPAAKFDVLAGKALLNYCDNLSEDKILLIITGKLSSAQKKTKWYKAIADKGSVSLIWPLKPNEHKQWIQQRLQKNALKADLDSIHLLAELTEGNLLATNQAIIKLRLLHAKKMIGIKEMADVIGDNAQFNVFELSQHLLKGDARNALRVLYQLKAQDTQTTLILWLLAKECRGLLEMSHEVKHGKSMRDVLAKQWSNLKSLYEMALRRLTIRQLSRALSTCHEADQVIKGLKPGDPWTALTHTILILVGRS